jgi:hypothetical protein
MPNRRIELAGGGCYARRMSDLAFLILAFLAAITSVGLVVVAVF